MVDIYQGIAGVADHLAGSTDEATGRFFQDAGRYQESGGLEQSPTQRATAYTRLGVRNFLSPDAEDIVFQSPSGGFLGNEDESNIAGPNVWGSGGVTDVLVTTEGESRAGELSTRLFLYAVVAAVALWLLKPLLELGAAVAE